MLYPVHRRVTICVDDEMTFQLIDYPFCNIHLVLVSDTGDLFIFIVTWLTLTDDIFVSCYVSDTGDVRADTVPVSTPGSVYPGAVDL